MRPSDPRAAPAGLGREQSRGGGSVGASQGETALSPPQSSVLPGAECAQQESPELHGSQRRDPQWTRRESLAVRVPEEAPLPVEVVPDAALPLQTAGAFFGQASFGEQGGGAGLTERAGMPAGVFRGKDGEFTLVPSRAVL